jgi:hypothetical protein
MSDRRDLPSHAGDTTMTHVKYVLIVLCTFSLCAKIVGHTYRHLHPAAVEITMQ